MYSTEIIRQGVPLSVLLNSVFVIKRYWCVRKVDKICSLLKTFYTKIIDEQIKKEGHDQ